MIIIWLINTYNKNYFQQFTFLKKKTFKIRLGALGCF